MTDISFVHLQEIREEELIKLMNNKKVGEQMPLLAEGFSRENCQAFLKAKVELWEEHGYGPWAFLIKGEFAGWGGLQYEQGEADFAMVLHPKFWGWGRKIFQLIKDQAFNQIGLDSITVLFPPSRTNSRAIIRLGFTEDGEVSVDGIVFMRFRLNKS